MSLEGVRAYWQTSRALATLDGAKKLPTTGTCWERMNHGRKIHALTAKLRDGYRITVSITEDEKTRELIARTVSSRFEAVTIAKAFASHYDIPWHKVEVASG